MGVPVGLRVPVREGVDEHPKIPEGGYPLAFTRYCKKINRSHTHTHTHTPTEHNTPDTDTHADDENNTPNEHLPHALNNARRSRDDGAS